MLKTYTLKNPSYSDPFDIDIVVDERGVISLECCDGIIVLSPAYAIKLARKLVIVAEEIKNRKK